MYLQILTTLVTRSDFVEKIFLCIWKDGISDLVYWCIWGEQLLAYENDWWKTLFLWREVPSLHKQKNKFSWGVNIEANDPPPTPPRGEITPIEIPRMYIYSIFDLKTKYHLTFLICENWWDYCSEVLVFPGPTLHVDKVGAVSHCIYY